MAHEQAPRTNRVSRRDFLFTAAAGGGAMLAAGALVTPAEASKMSPRAMSYRAAPNGKQRCDNCANWQPPGSCKLVDGAIAPNGWCILYRSRQ